MQVVLNQVRAEVNEARIALAAARDKAALAQAGLQAATKETALAKERYAMLNSGQPVRCHHRHHVDGTGARESRGGPV